MVRISYPPQTDYKEKRKKKKIKKFFKDEQVKHTDPP